MPKTARNRRRIDDSSSDESLDTSGEQSSQPKIQKVTSQLLNTSLNEEDVTKITQEVIFYLLVQERKRAPIKINDIYHAVNLNGKKKDVQNKVLRAACKRLEKTFGYKVIEPEEKRGILIIVNQLSEKLQARHLTFSDNELAQMGVLNIILGFIFMSGGMVMDDQLFKFLKKIGLCDDVAEAGQTASRKSIVSTSAPGVSSEVRALLGGNMTSLIFKEWGQRQMYLDVKKIDSGETGSPRFEIRWGLKAKIEIKESVILSLMASIYKVHPRTFKKEYDEIVEKEGEEAFAGCHFVHDDDDGDSEGEEANSDQAMEED